MRNEEGKLDDLFRRYRAACPEPEISPEFMPSLWRRIEARQNFWSAFGRFSKPVTTASAAVCLVLLALNVFFTPAGFNSAPTYADALMADHSAERTYYAEALHSSSPDFLPGR